MTIKAITERALACIGTRWHPGGRIVGVGLDCVGVILHAFDLLEYDSSALRARPCRIEPEVMLSLSGFMRADCAAPGRILVSESLSQPHLGVCVERDGVLGLVHCKNRIVVFDHSRLGAAWELA